MMLVGIGGTSGWRREGPLSGPVMRPRDGAGAGVVWARRKPGATAARSRADVGEARGTRYPVVPALRILRRAPVGKTPAR